MAMPWLIAIASAAGFVGDANIHRVGLEIVDALRGVTLVPGNLEGCGAIVLYLGLEPRIVRTANTGPQ